MRSTSEMRRIFPYFLNPASTPGAGGNEMSNARDMVLQPGLAFEDVSDDLVQRRVLHAHVDNGVLIENGGEHVGDARAIDLQVRDRPLAVGNLAEPRQIVRRFLRELQLHELVAAELLG